MSTIAVIDYGMGNLHSMAKAVEHVAEGHRVIITADAAQIREADRIVFPGQGAARDCMQELKAAGLETVLREVALDRPFFGVCMGLQVLLGHSEEGGGTDCLGILPGRVRYFGDNLHDAQGERLKIPQMGWNQVHQTFEHPLWQGIPQDSRFYFVHSYFVEPDEAQLVAGTTEYSRQYASVLAKSNLFAVQFHPEKSQHHGLQLIRNFVTWDGKAA